MVMDSCWNFAYGMHLPYDDDGDDFDVLYSSLLLNSY